MYIGRCRTTIPFTSMISPSVTAAAVGASPLDDNRTRPTTASDKEDRTRRQVDNAIKELLQTSGGHQGGLAAGGPTTELLHHHHQQHQHRHHRVIVSVNRKRLKVLTS